MDKAFGDWLRQRRKLLDLTRADLAERVGCAPVTIRKLESGDRKPSRDLAAVLALALRVPEREIGAFVQFARTDDLTESDFHLPAWEPERPTWRQGQLPVRSLSASADRTDLILRYDLIAQEKPHYSAIEDGRHLIHLKANGPLTDALVGTIEVRITQVIQPKPSGVDISHAVPMSIAAYCTIHSGDDRIEGTYTGMYYPFLDTAGNGHGRLQGSGTVLSITAGFVDLLLCPVFVEDEIKVVEGDGVGASGVMQIVANY